MLHQKRNSFITAFVHKSWSRSSVVAPKCYQEKLCFVFVFLIIPQSVSSCSYRHILENRAGTCFMWDDIKHEHRAMNECQVWWVQCRPGASSTGTGWHIWLHWKTFRLYRKSEVSPIALMLPTLPLRCTGESLTFKFSITSLLMTRSAEEFEKVTEDTSSNRERNHVAEWWKLGEKRQESGSGHFVKSLYEREMIQTSR